MMKYGLSSKMLLNFLFAGSMVFGYQSLGFAESALPIIEGLIVGAGPGGQPRVDLLTAKMGTALSSEASLVPFAQTFKGGVTVASGDTDGDKVEDLIVASGAGAPSDVRVFDGRTRKETLAFSPFPANFLGGVEVASGDLNGDKKDDIIVAAGKEGPPHVMAFDAATGKVICSFYAYRKNFLGGVTVGAVDIDGDGKEEIITGAGAGGAPHVKVFRGADGTLMKSFLAFEPQFRGGVSVAGGFIDNDKFGDIIVGAGQGASSHVAIFSGASNSVLSSFYAFDAGFKGGIRVGASHKPYLMPGKVIVGAGIGGHSHVLILKVVDGKPSVDKSFPAFPGFDGPVSVAGFIRPFA